MKHNKFVQKFSSKTDSELREIIDNPKGYVAEARQAAAQLLQTRNPEENTSIPEIEPSPENIQLTHLKIQDSFKRVHQFAWTPKYQEEFRTDLSATLIVSISKATFEKIGWEIVYEASNLVEAKRVNNWEKATEKIIVIHEHGKVTVQSNSIKANLWDAGWNSVRVKLFRHVFDELLASYSNEQLQELEVSVQKENNWDDYQIPDTLPKPINRKKPNFFIPVLGGILISLTLGFVIATVATNGIYVIGLVEVLSGIVLGFGFKYLIQWSNYTHYKQLQFLTGGLTLLIYTSNLWFQYGIIFNHITGNTISFWNFLELRFNMGLQYKEVNLGSIGLVVFWAVQLVLTFYVAMMRITGHIISYEYERAPQEVIDFAMYHMVKGKQEAEIRHELSKMGWANKSHQDDVFAAIGAIYDAVELRRMD